MREVHHIPWVELAGSDAGTCPGMACRLRDKTSGRHRARCRSRHGPRKYALH